VPPEFRVRFLDWTDGPVDLRTLAREIKVKTTRPDGSTQVFIFAAGKNDTFLHSMVDIPEPHSFTADVMFRGQTLPIVFAEAEDHEEGHSDHAKHAAGHVALEDDEGHVVTASSHKYEQDNNFRAAVMHVVADAFVSVLTIIAIGIAGTVPGAWWLNPAVGILGSMVILSWAYQLIGDTTSTLLDLCPDQALNDKLCEILQSDKESFVTDIHVWKLGPGKLGMIVSIMCAVEGRTRDYYAQKLSKFKALAHLTVELLPYDANYVHDHAHSAIEHTAGTHSDHGDHGHDHGHGHGHGGHKGHEGDGFVYAPMHT
jgi:Co/Zn/Cd efflux system component